MAGKRGLLVVIEGIDGAGTSTQLPLLTSHIKRLSKYNDVLETHEPWKSEEIKEKIISDEDAYSNGLKMAELFVEDRTEHTSKLIKPNLEQGVFILSDRYSMSTCAYQWAQGIELSILLEMHENRDIITPDMTLYMDVSANLASDRMKKRGRSLEKFERDIEFSKKLVECYRNLIELNKNDKLFFGNVVQINGNQTIEEVSRDIREAFNELYDSWLKS